MSNINIREAKNQLTELIDAVCRGEQVTIVRAGKPVANLVPIDAPLPPVRKPGSLKGRIEIADDFDAPLPNAALTIFKDEAQ